MYKLWANMTIPTVTTFIHSPTVTRLFSSQSSTILVPRNFLAVQLKALVLLKYETSGIFFHFISDHRVTFVKTGTLVHTLLLTQSTGLLTLRK